VTSPVEKKGGEKALEPHAHDTQREKGENERIDEKGAREMSHAKFKVYSTTKVIV